LALEQKERRGIWEATAAAAAVASFSLSPTSFVFFCYLANFVKPPKPANPNKKRVFFSVVKIPVITYTQTKTTSASPFFPLSLSLSLPQNKRKGPPKFLGQFPKSQVHPKNKNKNKNKKSLVLH
jgi:hypothetical protein